jgi:hypothetical protein
MNICILIQQYNTYWSVYEYYNSRRKLLLRDLYSLDSKRLGWSRLQYDGEFCLKCLIEVELEFWGGLGVRLAVQFSYIDLFILRAR